MLSGVVGVRRGRVGRVRLWRRCVILSVVSRCYCCALWSVMEWDGGRGEENLLCKEVSFFFLREGWGGGLGVYGCGEIQVWTAWSTTWSRCRSAMSRYVYIVAVWGKRVGEVVWLGSISSRKELSWTSARQSRKDACMCFFKLVLGSG